MHHARKFQFSFWAGNLLTTAMAVMPHKNPERARKQPCLWTSLTDPNGDFLYLNCDCQVEQISIKNFAGSSSYLRCISALHSSCVATSSLVLGWIRARLTSAKAF